MNIACSLIIRKQIMQSCISIGLDDGDARLTVEALWSGRVAFATAEDWMPR